MIVRVKCTYADMYNSDGKILQQTYPVKKNIRFVGRGQFIGNPTGNVIYIDKKQYVECVNIPGFEDKTYYFKKVAINLFEEDNTNYGDSTRENTKGGLLLGLAALLFLGD